MLILYETNEECQTAKHEVNNAPYKDVSCLTPYEPARKKPIIELKISEHFERYVSGIFSTLVGETRFTWGRGW
jgi:hypothetical protein